MNGKSYARILRASIVSGALLIAMPAFAAQGGEGNNTGCNGQGNANSPCNGNGNGGEGSSPPSIIYNNNTDIQNRNYNKNRNVNQNTAVSVSNATATSVSAAEVNVSQTQGSSNTIEGDSVRVYATAPSAFAPALTSAPETCFGSTSAGASGGNGIFGFGLSFGTTWKSDDCELRMFARSLQALGETKAALALLAQNEKVAAALKEAAAK